MNTYDAGLLGDYGGGNVEWWHDYIRFELARAREFYAEELQSALAVKDAALESASEHVTELREAWMTGALSERDGKGGWRSNRNVDVEFQIRAALEAGKG